MESCQVIMGLTHNCLSGLLVSEEKMAQQFLLIHQPPHRFPEGIAQTGFAYEPLLGVLKRHHVPQERR